MVMHTVVKNASISQMATMGALFNKSTSYVENLLRDHYSTYQTGC